MTKHMTQSNRPDQPTVDNDTVSPNTDDHAETSVPEQPPSAADETSQAPVDRADDPTPAESSGRSEQVQADHEDSDSGEQPPAAEIAGDQATQDACDVVPTPEEQPSGLQELLDAVRQVQQQLSQTEQNQTQLSDTVSAIAHSQKLAAEQVRRVGGKVDRVTAVVADSKVRELVDGLLLFYDLLSGLADAEAAVQGSNDSMGMLQRQLKQLLARNGVDEIATDAPLDFDLHRPVKQVTTCDEAEHHLIQEVIRAGFQCGDQVIRPAEVVIAAYVAPDPAERIEEPESDMVAPASIESESADAALSEMDPTAETSKPPENDQKAQSPTETKDD